MSVRPKTEIAPHVFVWWWFDTPIAFESPGTNVVVREDHYDKIAVKNATRMPVDMFNGRYDSVIASVLREVK